MNQSADTSVTLRPRASWFVPAEQNLWHGLGAIVRCRTYMTTNELALQAGWAGSAREPVGQPFNPLREVSDQPLENLKLVSPLFIPRWLEITVLKSTAIEAQTRILVIPALHARFAWAVLTVGVLLALLRALAAAALLADSASAVFRLLLGGAALTGGLVSLAKAVLVWLKKAHGRLLGMFAPHVAIAAALGFGGMLIAVLVTGRGVLVVNRTKVETQAAVGVELPLDRLTWFLTKPRFENCAQPPAKPCAKLTPRKRPEESALGFWANVLRLGRAPEYIELTCAPIVFAIDAKRVRPGAKGVREDPEDHRAVVEQDTACAAQEAEAVVWGEPRADAAVSSTLATKAGFPWPEYQSAGAFQVVAADSKGSYWVRALNTITPTNTIRWLALSSRQTSPAALPWPTSVFEVADALDAPPRARLELAACDGPLVLRQLKFSGGPLSKLELKAADATTVMTWTRVAGTNPPVIACGSGRRLELTFDGQDELGAVEVAIPKNLGVREVAIRAGRGELGTAMCPGSGDAMLTSATFADGCTQTGPSPQGAPRWTDTLGGHKPWFCLPANAGSVPVELHSNAGKPLTGVLKRSTGGGFVLEKQCGKPKVCGCLLGDEFVPASRCKHGCNDRASEIRPGCDVVLLCTP
jgi:hypothetical protein